MNRTAVSNNAETYVNLIQTGYNNNIRLNSLNEDTQTVHQVGNKNDYENFVYFNKEKTNKTINQEGNMNSLLIFGENSMMKNLIINQKADFQSIVIKNFTN
jgi:adenine deaminase